MSDIAYEDEIAKLRATVDTLNERLEESRDVANSLWTELDVVRAELKEARATIDRLRLHIQQGVEL